MEVRNALLSCRASVRSDTSWCSAAVSAEVDGREGEGEGREETVVLEEEEEEDIEEDVSGDGVRCVLL
jgi:hypothetical protein